jgi:hypothetical protein
MAKEKNVLFRDPSGMIYIGKKDDTGALVGFKDIQIQMDLKDISTYSLKSNEFLIAEVEEEGTKLKVTPITKAELGDTADGRTNEIHLMDPAHRLELFNGVIG